MGKIHGQSGFCDITENIKRSPNILRTKTKKPLKDFVSQGFLFFIIFYF